MLAKYKIKSKDAKASILKAIFMKEPFEVLM